MASAAAQSSKSSSKSSKKHKIGPKAKVPVLSVCGWLGSGKTTLLEYLIKKADGLRIGILVNDMASVNVDANTLAKVVHHKEEMVEFSNGTLMQMFVPHQEFVYPALQRILCAYLALSCFDIEIATPTVFSGLKVPFFFE